MSFRRTRLPSACVGVCQLEVNVPARPRDWSAAEDNAVFALRALGWSGPKIAAALERSPISLERHLYRLRKAGSAQPFKKPPPTYSKVRPADSPIKGETWTEVPARGLCVSSHGRVISSRSGYLRSCFKQTFNGKLAVNYETDERRGTITLENLVREAAGELPKPRLPMVKRAKGVVRLRLPKSDRTLYTASEDEMIRGAGSSGEARSLLPHRSLMSVRRRARILGVPFARQKTYAVGNRASPAAKARPVRVTWTPPPAGSGPLGRADYNAARAAVPTKYGPDLREDLINDIVVMQLEGFRGDAHAAFQIVRARHNRVFNGFRDVSFDAPIGGTEDLRLSDVISSDHPHF